MANIAIVAGMLYLCHNNNRKRPPRMKNISQNWYRLLAALCIFLLILMVYRREARMRTSLDSMEARLTALETYVRGAREYSEEKVKSNEERVASRDERRTPLAKKTPQPKKPAETKVEEVVANGDIVADAEPATGKFRQVARIELNTVDSTTLVRVPGIGEGTARKILQYRERLGGYFSAEQIREKVTWEGAQNHLDDWCENWFWADEQLIQKIQINKLTFKELLRHPYLDYDDVKAIVRWRDRHGAVRGVEDLKQLGLADSAKLASLLHYVEF